VFYIGIFILKNPAERKLYKTIRLKNSPTGSGFVNRYIMPEEITISGGIARVKHSELVILPEILALSFKMLFLSYQTHFARIRQNIHISTRSIIKDKR